MNLRARLVIAFTSLLLIVIAAVGVMAVNASRTVLTSQVDETLDGIRDRLGGPFGRFFAAGPFAREDNPARQLAAVVVVDTAGNVVFAEPSGFTDAPDPLPSIREIPDLASSGDIETIPSDDGTLEYRAFAREVDGLGIELWAVPLDEVDAAVALIVQTVVLTGVGVALIGGGLTWWTVRRGLRPVAEMVDTATAIAGGDLSQRVGDPDPSTELGQLGWALNDMLSQLESALTQEQTANERLKQFVADASHELRTPLAAVRGYTELYRKGALEDRTELDNAIGRIRRETVRMERLVSDLLLLARLDRGQAMERRSVNLAAVVRDAVNDGRVIDPGRPIALKSPDSLRVKGDEQRLTQVVANLLANARVHTPEGTPVEVKLSRGHQDVVLEVTDDGPGLPPDSDRLFDRFNRVDDSRARDSGGAGLGLSIVVAIVKGHGGTVEAGNEPGRGARFIITIPAEA